MSSKPLGSTTSDVEVTNISGHGTWLLAADKESFMSYEDFPWFKDVAVAKILNVELSSPGHFTGLTLMWIRESIPLSILNVFR